MKRKINISVIVLLIIILVNVPIKKDDLDMSYLILSNDESSPYNGEVLQITGTSYRFLTGRYHLKGTVIFGGFNWHLQDYYKSGDNTRVMSFTRLEISELTHWEFRGSLFFHNYMGETHHFLHLGYRDGNSYSYKATPLN